MSYSISIKVENGTAVIDAQGGQVPDGTIAISGHADAYYDMITVTRNKVVTT